ncbi:translation initiation factor IF-2-like [Elephas maximus indicus]|uniref:translation initiation factor IF-2-like n=1 Tax=Elephas maximus indicus TaxID=99487 RepID=UPI002116A80A|nr:translation initiation factor IF-2-like [Elephas maximus indicus]
MRQGIGDFRQADSDIEHHRQILGLGSRPEGNSKVQRSKHRPARLIRGPSLRVLGCEASRVQQGPVQGQPNGVKRPSARQGRAHHSPPDASRILSFDHCNVKLPSRGRYGTQLHPRSKKGVRPKTPEIPRRTDRFGRRRRGGHCTTRGRGNGCAGPGIQVGHCPPGWRRQAVSRHKLQTETPPPGHPASRPLHSSGEATGSRATPPAVRGSRLMVTPGRPPHAQAPAQDHPPRRRRTRDAGHPCGGGDAATRGAQPVAARARPACLGAKARAKLGGAVLTHAIFLLSLGGHPARHSAARVLAPQGRAPPRAAAAGRTGNSAPRPPFSIPFEPRQDGEEKVCGGGGVMWDGAGGASPAGWERPGAPARGGTAAGCAPPSRSDPGLCPACARRPGTQGRRPARSASPEPHRRPLRRTPSPNRSSCPGTQLYSCGPPRSRPTDIPNGAPHGASSFHSWLDFFESASLLELLQGEENFLRDRVEA